MRSAKTNNRSRAQRARREAEREDAPRAGPPSIPHGTRIGSIHLTYHGQVVEVDILQAGDKARTHGFAFNGQPPIVMGLYRALATAGGLVARLPGRRSGFW